MVSLCFVVSYVLYSYGYFLLNSFLIAPEVRFAQDDYVMNGETIAVVRRESISSIVKEKRSGRRKQRYRYIGLSVRRTLLHFTGISSTRIDTHHSVCHCRRPTTDLTMMPVEEPKASWLGKSGMNMTRKFTLSLGASLYPC